MDDQIIIPPNQTTGCLPRMYMPGEMGAAPPMDMGGLPPEMIAGGGQGPMMPEEMP